MRRLRVETFVNFDFRKLKKRIKPIIKDILKDKLGDIGVRQLKNNIKNFKGKGIEQSTKEIRAERGRSGNKPLQDTGKLLKSIKKVKGGVSIMAYGARQNDGFTLIPNNDDGSFGFYSGKGKKKRLVRFKGSSLKVPPRPWIPNEIEMDKKTQNEVFKHFMKVLRIKRKKIADTKVAL